MRTLLVANWKQYPDTPADARALFHRIARAVRGKRHLTVIVAPPAPFLSLFKPKGVALGLGAQDVSRFESGAHTGETSARMLKELGASFVIIGHSERRALGERSAIVAEKIRAALNAKLTPVVCIGEDGRDERGGHLHFLEKEIKESLEGISRERVARVVIAYEPLWAIGKSADDAITPHVLHETVLFIRKVLTKMYGRGAALAVSILYGGSVEPNNVAALVKTPGIAGFLVGHASRDAHAFKEIITIIEHG